MDDRARASARRPWSAGPDGDRAVAAAASRQRRLPGSEGGANGLADHGRACRV